MTDVTIDHLAAARADGSLVLDVREPHEYVTGHVPGALLMPVSEVPSRHGELPRDRLVYVICASGNRSRRVTDLLRGRGYDARSVLGGTSAWVGAGRPVVVGHRREARPPAPLRPDASAPPGPAPGPAPGPEPAPTTTQESHP